MKAHGFHSFFQIFSKPQTSSTIGTSPVWWNSHPIPWKRHGASKNQRTQRLVQPLRFGARARYTFVENVATKIVCKFFLSNTSVLCEIWTLYKSFIGRNHLLVLFSCNILRSRPTFKARVCRINVVSGSCLHRYHPSPAACTWIKRDASFGTVEQGVDQQMKGFSTKRIYTHMQTYLPIRYFSQLIVYDAAGQQKPVDWMKASTFEKQKQKKKHTCWVPVHLKLNKKNKLDHETPILR